MAGPRTTQIWGDISNGDAEDISSTGTFYSRAASVCDSPTWAIQIQWTGTVTTTTYVIQESCRPDPDFTTDDDWVDDSSITLTAPGGGAVHTLNNVGNSGAYWVRVKAVVSGGTGTVLAHLHGKKNRT